MSEIKTCVKNNKVVFSSVLNMPQLGTGLFSNDIVRWFGVVLCMLGLIFFLLTLISFSKSFRVGIDEEQPGPLITTGTFAISRNPIYTAFGFVLLGIFLTFSNGILLLYLIAGIWLFNRLVLREEDFLKKIYAYFGRIRTLIPATSGQRFGIIRTA